MQEKTVYVIIKTYYIGRKRVKQESYGYSLVAKDCFKKIKAYKNVLKNREESFLANEKIIHGVYNNVGLDVIGRKRRIEFRIHRIIVMM